MRLSDLPIGARFAVADLPGLFIKSGLTKDIDTPGPCFDAIVGFNCAKVEQINFDSSCDVTPLSPGAGLQQPGWAPRVFYLSGPMRGIPKFNFPAFDAAAEQGRERGHVVISPADLDRDAGHTEDDCLDAINTPAHMRLFATRDCETILSLRAENGDGIALLPGWERSTGGMAEFMLARWLSLTVLNAKTWTPFTDADLDVVNWGLVVPAIRAAIRRTP